MDVNVADMSKQVNVFLDQLSAWAAVALPSLISAIVLLIVGWWFAEKVNRAIRKVIQGRIEPTLVTVIASIVRYGILVVVIVAVLGQLGIQTTSILAALGAAGLAIGLAMQGTLQNIAAGMMLLWLRPFRVGDYIDTGDTAGTVKDIGLFAAELHSWDGIYQFVPNAELWNRRIINYSRLPTRLVNLKFGVSYDDDIAKGSKVLLDLGTSDERVLKEPEPIVFVDSLDDSAVTLALRVWVSSAEYWDVRRALTERGKLALEVAGLSIPFPQRDVHIQNAPPGGGKSAAA